MRNALVTGGTRGIGRAVAELLHRDGASVSVVGRSTERPSGLPEYLNYYGADLSTRDGISEIKLICAESLKPDILVNNVGLNIKGRTSEFPISSFDEVFRVNVECTFALIQANLPHMTHQRWGRIVNISSLWAFVGNEKNGAYCGAKAAVDGITRSVATEVSRYNVLVNAVSPGFTLTDDARAAFTEEELSETASHIPINRLAEPEEIGELVSWLASERNSYTCGQSIIIDGGLTRAAHPFSVD